MSDPHLQFGRAYRIKIDTIGIDSTLSDHPLQVQFSVKKTLKPEPNKVELHVYNLSADHRNQIDQAVLVTSNAVTGKTGKIKGKKGSIAGLTVPVQIDAGYKSALSTLFLGDLRTALSTKDKTAWITSLACGDGENAIRTSRVSLSIAKGTSVDRVVTQVAMAIGVSKGNLDKAVQGLKLAGLGASFSQGTVLTGSASREMTNICRSVGIQWSIQNGALQLLPLGTALAGEAIQCDQDHGMLGSPSVDNKNVLTVRMTMAPDIFPGRLLVLDARQIAGNYRIEETTHTGDFTGTDWGVEIKAQRY